MKKLLLALILSAPIFAQTGIVDIPDTLFPKVRSLMNRNFSWLDANKADKIHNHDGRYALFSHVHTGFESVLSFSGPLQRVGNTVSCPTCTTGAFVSSVFGRGGVVTAQTGDYTTSQVTEGSNLYFTDSRAVNAVQTLLDAKLNLSALDTDATLAANSDAKVPSQKAIKAYVDGKTMRGLVFPFDGGDSALIVGKTVYLRVPFACAISNWSIESTTSETVTAKVWLVSGGTALPTASNSITSSGISLTTGNFTLSTNLSDFTTTAVPQDAQLAATLTAVTASQFVNLTLGCKQ